MQPLTEILHRRLPNVWITKALILVNSIVFIAMLVYGAGFLHSSNGVQLAWGANFSPATQDGQWWRLGSAMFLHFGVLHLLLNMWALWDAGQLVERMFGYTSFLIIYLVSGLFGNLASLVFQGNSAISGGASGAIFGIFGALLIYLWFNRSVIHLREFRWLFWGAVTFSVATIVFGFIVPGIDNSAHIGGFTAGLLASILFVRQININAISKKISYGAIILLVLLTFILVLNLPKPKYLWSDELLLRNKINEFTFQEQEINRSWLEILHEQKKSGLSLNELAGKVETKISEPYEDSFEKLSHLPVNAALPSAIKLKSLITYTKQRKEESKALAEKFRKQENKISK